MSATDKTLNGGRFLALLCRLQVCEPAGQSVAEGRLHGIETVWDWCLSLSLPLCDSAPETTLS